MSSSEIIKQSRVERVKAHFKKDRVRNKLFRWLGFVPIEEFDAYILDAHNMFKALTKFTEDSNTYFDKIEKRFHINDDSHTPNLENNEKGMIY